MEIWVVGLLNDSRLIFSDIFVMFVSDGVGRVFFVRLVWVVCFVFIVCWFGCFGCYSFW